MPEVLRKSSASSLSKYVSSTSVCCHTSIPAAALGRKPHGSECILPHPPRQAHCCSSRPPPPVGLAWREGPAVNRPHSWGSTTPILLLGLGEHRAAWLTSSLRQQCLSHISWGSGGGHNELNHCCTNGYLVCGLWLCCTLPACGSILISLLLFLSGSSSLMMSPLTFGPLVILSKTHLRYGLSSSEFFPHRWWPEFMVDSGQGNPPLTWVLPVPSWALPARVTPQDLAPQIFQQENYLFDFRTQTECIVT